MPTLDDIPTLALVSPTGLTSDDLLPIYDLTAKSSSKVRKVPSGFLTGIGPSDLAVFGDTSAVASASAPVATTSLIAGSANYQVTSIALPATVGFYAVVPAVTVSGGTATVAATVTAVLSNVTYGSIVGFNITNAGVYTTATAPTLAIAVSTTYTPITTRVSFGIATTTKLTLPPVGGSIRDVRIIKAGAGNCEVTPSPADGITASILFSGASATAVATLAVATTTAATFFSNGTYWYRVA